MSMPHKDDATLHVPEHPAASSIDRQCTVLPVSSPTPIFRVIPDLVILQKRVGRGSR